MRSFVLASGFAAVAADGNRFDNFVTKYGRKYTSQDEKDHRRQIFNDNVALIDAENAKGHSYTLGVTNMADLTFPEFKLQYLTGFVPSKKNTDLGAFQSPVGFVAAESVDWTTKGAVTPVKNQAQCGSCWSFSTTGALEGAAFIAGRGLTSLSEQNILDCDTGGNKCQGGSMDQAFGWVQSNGLCSEDSDTYKCADQTSTECTLSKCPTSCTQTLKAGDVTGYTDVASTEGALEAAVMQQPVSVAIEADQSVFQHYTSGILTDSACGEKLDHGVLVVGYGTDNGTKYWKVKNSWGTSFGEDGYIRIEKGSATDGGECGIRSMASFPTVKAASDQIIV